MKTVIMPPDAPTLMWSTRAIGYTTPSAVADLIDNSISAMANEIHIVYMSGEDGYVSILDNGEGMSPERLQLAMKYGSGSPTMERAESDLGRFGLGLKTASLSQCRQLTVVSKQRNVVSGYCWDLDHVFATKEWELLELDYDELLSLPQIDKLLNMSEGTLVIWNKLDKMCAGDSDKEKGFLLRIKEVEEHLSKTFHRFMQGENGINKVSIYSNGVLLQPDDPFFVGKSNEMPAEPIAVEYTNASGENAIAQVKVVPYILPFSDSITQEELDSLGGKDGLIKNQGFYVYRNRRLIVSADWFRLARKTDLTKLCRVRVDIPNTLDELWTIDVKKSMAVPPEIVLRNLKRIISPIIHAGKRKYSFRATTETRADHGVRLWLPQETRNGMVYSINPEYPIYKDLIESIPDKRKWKVFIRLLEQNIPVNAIHTDFYDDKKYAFEDVDVALENVKKNLRDLLVELPVNVRREEFGELMKMKPFSEYTLSYEDLGDF